MDTKSLRINVPDTVKEFPITLSSFSGSGTLLASFDTEINFSIRPLLLPSNLVSNPDFSLPDSSASTIDDWTLDSYWYRAFSTSGSSGTEYPYATVSFPEMDTVTEISSGSFPISADTSYRFGLSIKADNGKILYENPDTGKFQSESLLPQYYATVSWLSGSVISDSDYIITSASGRTSYGGDLTDYTYANYGYIYIPLEWKNYVKNITSPAGVDGGKITVYAFYSMPTTYDSGYYKKVLYPPKFNINSVHASSSPVHISISGHDAEFGDEIEFIIDEPEVDQVTYTASALSSVDTGSYIDCYGEYVTEVFSTTSDSLYVGHSDTQWNRYISWIPFKIDFTNASGGIHVVSASLEVVATESFEYNANEPSRVIVGFVEGTYPDQPESVGDIRATTYDGALHTLIAENWIEGETYDFDITNAAKNYFGAGDSRYGITWNNGDLLALALRDWGSEVGQYKSIASSSNPYYTSPKISIVYADNYYTTDAVDICIFANGSVNVTKGVIDVGKNENGSIRRDLIYFDVSSIPSGATVDSATLKLYHAKSLALTSSTMYCYRIINEWDYYTGTWYRNYGTSEWDTAGLGAGTDRAVATSGSLSLIAAETDGYKNISISASLVEDWIDGTYDNYGLLLKMGNESGQTAHRFYSSQATNQDRRPVLTVAYTYGGDGYVLDIKSLKNIKKSLERGTVDLELSADTRIYPLNGEDDKNFDYTNILATQGPNVYWTSLMRPDFTDLPTGATIVAVKFYIYSASSENPGKTTDTLYRLRKTFVEDEATWLEWKSGYRWATSGAQNTTYDRYSTAMGTLIANADYYDKPEHEFSCSINVSEFQALQSNNTGIVMVRTGTLADARTYWGRAFNGDEDRYPPKFVVEYTI